MLQYNTMNWIPVALLTALFYGAYNVFIKLSSGHISHVAGAVILQAASLLTGGILIFTLHITHQPLTVTPKGIGYATLAGIMVGLAEIMSFLVFAKGVPAVAGVPVIIGGSVIAGAIFGAIFLRETLQPSVFFGVALIVCGIVLITASQS